LGHTERDKIIKPLKNRFDFPNIAGTSEFHRREFEADRLALIMMAGLTCENVEQRNRKYWLADATNGALLTFITIGHAMGGMNISTVSHPSATARYDKCLEFIKKCEHNDVALDCEKDLYLFNATFEYIQEHQNSHKEFFQLAIFDIDLVKKKKGNMKRLRKAMNSATKINTDILEIIRRERKLHD